MGAIVCRSGGDLPPRVRGAKSVLVSTGSGSDADAAVRFVLKKLLHDVRFDCRIVGNLDNNELPHSEAVVMCRFGRDSLTPELKAFAARGGKVVFVADTEEKRRLAAAFDGATVVDSYDKIMDVL